MKLSHQQAELLYALNEAKGTPLGAERISFALWGHSDVSENFHNTIVVQIHRLRKRLGALNTRIVNEYGQGWRLVFDDIEGTAA